jgi:hypothetical protein
MPLFMLVAGLSRLGWGLKVATGARWRDVPFAMMVMLALSWTVTRACLHGLIRERGVFLRTPKVRTPSRLRQALASASFETTISLAFLVAAPVLFLLGPRPLAVVMSLMLLWQGLAWGSAPAASLAAQGIELTPARLIFRQSPQNTGARAWSWPLESSRLVLIPALALAIALLAPALVVGGGDDGVQGQLGLPPSKPAAATPTPATGAPGTPSAKSSATPSPTVPAAASPSATPTARAHASPSAQPTPSHHP